MAGFIAGSAAGIVNNPFDILKSRQQVAASAALPNHLLAQDYLRQHHSSLSDNGTSKRWIIWKSKNGVIYNLVSLIKTEGLISLTRGLSAKLLRLGPGSAIIFVVYETSLPIITQLRRRNNI
jgi:hypothetical protein